MLSQPRHSCCHCSVSCVACFCFLFQENLHDPQEGIESGKEDLKREESLEPVAKDTWAEMAKVSCSNEHMLSQPQHSCCHCSVSPVAFLCSQENMHDPQEEMESGKEDLKKEEGLEPVAKDTRAEVAKVSCSHEHMLSQLCLFLQIVVLSHLL